MPTVEQALWYSKKGFSIIPAKRDKRPYVKWTAYQDTPADEVQIREWWGKWPDANIAIITGKVSGVTVLDADSQEGKDSVQEFMSDSILVPTVKTPHGWHFYFRWGAGLSNGVKVLHECDLRTDGGYVIAPPSKNGSSTEYEWMDGLHIAKTTPPEIPSMLNDILTQQCFKQLENNTTNNLSSSLLYSCQIVPDKRGQAWTDVDKATQSGTGLISKGRRDDTFFHLANCLVRGGMSEDNIRYFLNLFLLHCTESDGEEPFTEKDIDTKIRSALDRAKNRDVNVAEIVREYVMSTRGHFTSTECRQMSTLSTRKEIKAMSAVLSRMVAEGVIERVGNKNGYFRRVEKDLNVMDIFSVQSDFLDIKYPLGLHELFATMPKNIIVIAGTPNVGKTAFMLNIAAMNMNRGMGIRYFTSEMGELELSKRLKAFEPETPFSFWKQVQFCDHASGFADRIDPDGINIIDYLEMTNEFWMIGERLSEIYKNLNKGIAIVGLQKKFGQKYGRGAEFSLEKPRLYVSLESNPPEGNIAQIMKCKNHARDDINPNNMECVFNVIGGVKIKQRLRWSHPGMKEVKDEI